MRLSRGTVLQLVCLAAVAALADGCKSAQKHHEEADTVAREIIEEKQEQLGKKQPFTIETSAENLRRQLMIDQQLPHSSDASLSSKDVETPKHWPEEASTRPSTQPSPAAATTAPTTSPIAAPVMPPPLRLSLEDALKVGARNSRQYQTQKERIFIDALALDLRRDDFRTTFVSSSQATVLSDQSRGSADPQSGGIGTTSLSLGRKFKNGASLASRISVDVVSLFTGNKDSSYGVGWDTSITMPLLRGGGAAVVLEPLTQAERNVAYDLLEFEQYKRRFAVDVASQYLAVLSQYDQIRNAETAYKRAISSTRRARRQADAGRLPEIQVDQSVQQELRARDRWTQAQANLGRRQDSFKVLLGLPPDANVVLDPAELARLSDRITDLVAPQEEAIAESGKTDAIVEAATMPAAEATNDEAAPVVDVSEIVLPPSSLTADGSRNAEEEDAIRLALKHRPDLQVANGEVYDAQRRVVVAANALEAGLTLEGRAGSAGRRNSLGSAASENGTARLDEGVYSGSLLLDLPLERTAERNAYRSALINVESSVRDLQQAEDVIKTDVRGAMRELLLGRESIRIQARSVAVAQKRVDSTNLFLDAGRAQIRDVLEAQDALVQAQNSLTSALINYRVAELALQRDIGLLEVNSEGLWEEYQPMLAKLENKP